MGGPSRNIVLFEIVWHGDVEGKLTREHGDLYGKEDQRPLARTYDDIAPTFYPSTMITRIHTPATSQLPLSHFEIARLGEGAFGEVSKSVNVDTGRRIAVKHIGGNKRSGDNKNLEARRELQKQWERYYPSIKREVENLSKLFHVRHIFVRYIGHKTNHYEARETIFTDLLDGNLENLISITEIGQVSNIAEQVFKHMLRALAYLESMDLVHRDVKPANILYRKLPEQDFLFQLADFGLSNNVKAAVTNCGTPIFAAPELAQRTCQKKVDVWSLYVVIVWTLDLEDFRTRLCGNSIFMKPRRTQVLVTACTMRLAPIRDTAFTEPENRASVSIMLTKLFGKQTPGNGKTGSEPSRPVPRDCQPIKRRRPVRKLP
ncbi:hypothetical protein MMC07_009297 [Pseudocyphellaria aurata]|nr:hypothetical protein [Pseudocyphellaria aurata]